MRVLVALEFHFVQTSDGACFAESNYGYSFWQRYLTVFDEVVILARAKSVDTVSAGWSRVDGRGVSLCPLPDFRGPWQYLLARSEARRCARQAVLSSDRYILRVPGTVAALAEYHLTALGRSFAVEVVGDPWEAFSPGNVPSFVRPLARRVFAARLRRQCRNAVASAYVTAESLQQRYPPSPHAPTTHCSDVKLNAESIADSPRNAPTPAAGSTKDPWRLVFVGSLAQRYKGLHVLLEAIRLCADHHCDVRLAVVGDGKYRSSLERLTTELGVHERVDFLGKLPSGEPVWAQLRAADLFVMPSLTEGLPRAMIEAMAAALPCLGSDVGGLPELLSPEDLFPPGQAGPLAEKIVEVLRDRNRLAAMSRRNLLAAQQYTSDVLDARRRVFYASVRDQSDSPADGPKLPAVR